MKSRIKNIFAHSNGLEKQPETDTINQQTVQYQEIGSLIKCLIKGFLSSEII